MSSPSGPSGAGGPLAPPDFRDEGLIAVATRRPVAVTMVVLTVVIFGVVAFERLPQNLMPDISYPTLTVRTEYPGASPADVENRISRRLEEVLSQVRNLRRVSSISRAEVSDVILELAWNTSMGLATMDVREKVEQAVLPDGIPRPTILRYDPTLDPILQVGLLRRAAAPGGTAGGPDLEDLIDLRLLAEDLLERDLETVDGVAAVQVRGGYEREIRIEVSEAQLKTRGLSMALIQQRLKEENLNQASGQLYEGDQAYVVRTVNEFEDIEEIRDIILKREGAVPIRLRDIAAVSWSYAEPEVLSRIDGQPCVKVEIYKEADANIVEVARRVRERVFGTPEERQRLLEIRRKERALASGDPVAVAEREMEIARRREEEKRRGRPQGEGRRGAVGRGGAGPGGPPGEKGPPSFLASRLPPGDELRVLSDQSIFIQSALEDVRSTAVSGGVLAVLILYLFLRSFWFTMAVGLSIPISVVATFVAMYVFGVSLNLMSLGGLALGIGMLVDNSIVVLESIFRCREEGSPSRAAAVRGTQEVAGAVASSTLTTVAVFFPIVFVEGVAGQIFRDQALTVVISLLASLLVALYLIPACVGRGAGAIHTRERPQAAALQILALRELRDRMRLLRWRWSNAFFLAIWTLLLLASCAARLLVEAAGIAAARTATAALRGARWARERGRGLFGRGGGALLRGWEAGFERFRGRYERLLRFSLAHRSLVLALVLLALYLSVSCLWNLGSELVPEVHQGEFTIDVRLPVGSRLEKTDSVLQPLEARLVRAAADLPVESLTTTVGVEKDSIKAGDEGEHTARLLARLRSGVPLREAEEQVKERFREILAGEPELSSQKFENPVLFSFKTPIEVEVKGYNLAELKRITREIEEALRRIPSLKDVKSTVGSGYPEVHLRLDREILARYGLSVASVGEAVRQKVQGEVPSYFNEGDRRIGMRVRLLEGDRKSLEDLAGLIVNPGAATQLRLSDVIAGNRIEVSEGPAEIRRIGQQRAGVVTANAKGMDLGRLTAEVQTAIDRVKRPAGFLVGFGGQKEEMDQSLSSLTKALFLAIFLVYVVMAMQFESLVQPFVIILAVPLALVGVSPLLWALGMSLSVVVFIGMIILAGIVVNNAIVLIDCVNHLRARGMEVREALVAAGKIRMRPILMTTLTTVLGLLPLTGVLSGIPLLDSVLGTGEGSEIRAPLAVTVMGGLSASTALTLIVIPVVYTFVAGRGGSSAAATAPAEARDAT